MKLPACLALCLFFIGSSPALPADVARFSDYAQVIASEPVLEKKSASRRNTGNCRAARQQDPDFAPISPGITEDITHQEQRWAKHRNCGPATSPVPSREVTGYWVTYRYAGRNVSRFFPYDPGERVPVTVNLTPLP